MGREIVVMNWCRSAGVDAGAVRSLVAELAEAAGAPADCSVVFVGDRRMRGYNRRYRAKNATTDVLSFPAETEGYLGDIVISIPRLAAQARQLGHSVDEEAKVLITHGYLHLIGHDHEVDEGQMRRLELRLSRRIRTHRILRLKRR
ncbi:MAG: rRNA maturation RNase YbeY [Acidobacteriota bacterium]